MRMVAWMAWVLLSGWALAEAEVLSEGARAAAFIGYTEMARGACADRLTDCLQKSYGNGCLYDVFAMRTLCPTACNVRRCAMQGLKVRQHVLPCMSPLTPTARADS